MLPRGYIVYNKDRGSTEKKLKDAIERVLLSNGYKALGVNRIAKEAGVSKILIYRYFGNLEGLIKSYVEEKNYWIKLDKNQSLNLQNMSFKELETISANLFIGQLKELRENPAMLEIIRWQLMEKNPVVDDICKIIEARGVNTMKMFQKYLPEIELDIPVLIALLLGGIYEMALRSRNEEIFNTIDLQKEESWERIENAIIQFFSLVFGKMEEK
jgi:AcrR family transcriptional regulator